jgi:hypothetical protein
MLTACTTTGFSSPRLSGERGMDFGLLVILVFKKRSQSGGMKFGPSPERAGNWRQADHRMVEMSNMIFDY